MTSAADSEQHGDAAIARSSLTGRRGHWAWPWVLLILALPGTARSLWVVFMNASYGGEVSPIERGARGAAELSGASLWLATALVTAVLLHRVVVPVLCGFAFAWFAALASESMQPGWAPLGAADCAAWLSAWVLPTSWVVAVWGASKLVLWTYGHRRTALSESSRHAEH
ncbi:MAG: hypothetical protein WA890_12170 [Micromonospora sp.]